jgi:hypothetical protein
MRYGAAIILFLFISHVMASQNYGLQFFGQDYSLDHRNGLEIPATESQPIMVEESFELAFQLRFNPTSHRGYYGNIFRILVGDKNFDLIHWKKKPDWNEKPASKNFFLNFLARHPITDDFDFKLKITECIFNFDSLNEEAIMYQCKLLNNMGKHHLASKAYQKFIRNYQALYGEDYQKSFREVLKRV